MTTPISISRQVRLQMPDSSWSIFIQRTDAGHVEIGLIYGDKDRAHDMVVLDPTEFTNILTELGLHE